MTEKPDEIAVYLEIGKKRTIACAVEWPGWSRAGRDEESALRTLYEYGKRYALAVTAARAGFTVPASETDFRIIERLKGDAGTDYGVPAKVSRCDLEPVYEAELERLQSLLKAIWQAFDATVKSAEGKDLRKGPRGGGRDLEKIVRHVLESEAGYLSVLGWKHKPGDWIDLEQERQFLRPAVMEGLTRAAHGELPEFGPRGGQRWKPRYFVRRSAWHVLDHAWEIEDRIS